MYRARDRFTAIQELLKLRNHTFFTGPLHHEGPGNVDHIAWVTMTEGGPEIVNIALNGIFDRKGLDPSLFGAYDRKGAVPSEAKE